MAIRINTIPKTVSLSELIHFVQFDQFWPSPTRATNEYPEPTLDALASEIGLQRQQMNLFASAIRDVLQALRDGELKGRGRYSRTKAGTGPTWLDTRWHEHEASRTDIDPDFWSEKGVDWNNSSAKSAGGEYIDIVFQTADVLRIWRPDDVDLGSRNVPASDRSVSLDHNSAPYRQAIEALDAAISEAERSNSLGDLTAGERSSILSQLKTGRTLFDDKIIRISAYKTVLEPGLKWLLEKCADTAVGHALTAAWNAISKLLGLVE